jgi:hypothetical protein
MSRIIRRGHLILVAAFGKRVANPPVTAQEQRIADARRRAKEASKRRR